MSRALATSIALGIVSLGALMAWWPEKSEAAVANWQQGATLVPQSSTDLGSESARESLRDLAATGASHVGIVVPYYQSNTRSSDIAPGWNTPTDEALIAAIEYARSLGLQVTLKLHLESYDGSWRAHINPDDRDAWFSRYRERLLHLAAIAESHGAAMLNIGTELVSVAAGVMHPSNTANWQSLIADVRGVYSGSLVYGANSTNNTDDPFVNEKKFIEFWPQLDYAGLSVYYNLNSPTNAVDDIKSAWHFWNNNDIRAFSQSVGKPLLFLEIGYRSLEGARHDPWNWSRGGAVDLHEQAHAYEALLSYWNDYDYVHGVYWWKWETNPHAGGSGDNNYTPQNKPAEEVVTRWFTNAAPPVSQPQNPPTFTSDADPSPASPETGHNTTVHVSVQNIGDEFIGGIVDVEIYNESGQQVFQHFFENQSFGSGETKQYMPTWNAAAAGLYRVAIGVFTAGWSNVVHWNNEAATIAVGGNGGGEPPPPPPPENGDDTPPPAPGPENGDIDIWWPTDGAGISGTQPFKALLQDAALPEYRMFWQVDGDRLNEMHDSDEGWFHKRAWVDVSGWNWRGAGPYVVNFVARNLSGALIAERAVSILVH